CAAAPRRCGRTCRIRVRNRLPLVFMLLCLSPVSYHHCAAGCRASCYLYLVPHADVPRRMSCPRTTTELPHASFSPAYERRTGDHANS
ncbi:hypothetical protein C8J57DRAFT_1380092, partial [Mycena rebaudengoi]